MTASQAPRAIYPPLELELGELCACTCRQTGVRYRPGITHAGNSFFRAVEFLQMDSSGWCVAISVPDFQPSHIMTLAHRRLPPPHPNFRSLHHLRRIHRPPSTVHFFLSFNCAFISFAAFSGVFVLSSCSFRLSSPSLGCHSLQRLLSNLAPSMSLATPSSAP